MLVIHALLVVRVARDAREDRKVVGIRVAIGTCRPAPLMMPRIDREPLCVVVERRSLPGGGIVAGLAGRGKVCRAMVGSRVIVIRLMAEIAVRRRALKLAVDVALIAGNTDMRAGQGKGRVAVVKSRGIPCRCRVARCTIVIEPVGHMIRVGHSVEVGLMARVAVGMSLAERAAAVAGLATDRHVRAGERERREVVIERRRLPGVCRMAAAAKMVESSRRMGRILSFVVVFPVARVTRRRCSGKSPARVTCIARG